MFFPKQSKVKIIDLSMPIYEGMPTYPGDPAVSINVVHDYQEQGWQLRNICLGTHTGTHVDAFSHMDPNGKDLDQMPLEAFFGPAIVAENTQTLPAGIGLIFRHKLGMEELPAILAAQPPFVGGEFSIELERELLKNGIITYTNLINLELLPTGVELMFCGLPLRIRESDGSPVRAVAVLYGSEADEKK